MRKIQRGCVYDGPGIRTTVFLDGCAMDCPWCCNPEMGAKGIAAGCREYSPSELADVLARDAGLFRTSGGGVTFSGGEPLLQADGLVPVLELLRDIPVWFETALQVPAAAVNAVAPYASGFIIDLKLQREMHPDGKYLEMLRNAFALMGDVRKVFRLVFVDSVWEDRDRVVEMLRSLGVESLELLKCHNLAASKYAALGLAFRDYTPSGEFFAAFSGLLAQNGVENKMLTI